MDAALLTAAAGSGYLLGTVPSADLVARWVDRARRGSGGGGTGAVDLRRVGSGNPGALNAYRTLGRLPGAVVLVADAAKGVAAGGAWLAVAGSTAAQVALVAAIVGHCYPIWSRFAGGKGVATAAGGILALFPASFPVSFAAGVLAAHLTRRATVAMQVAVVAWLGAAGWWWATDWPNLWGVTPGPGLVATAAAGSAVVVGAFARARVSGERDRSR